MFMTILGLLIFLLLVLGIIRFGRFVAAHIRHRLETKRMGRPSSLSSEQRQALRKAHLKVRDAYLEDLRITWYQAVLIFVIGSVAGLILEETWMFITAHLTQSRVGLVWGPFSPLYGFGATFLTIITFQLRKHGAKPLTVFVVAVAVGGTLEQVTGWGMEHIFHAESWTYQYLPDHITKYIAWRFLFFWGLLGLIWYEYVMPNLLFLIGTPTNKRATAFVTILAVYLGLDIFMTLAVFDRMVQRDEGIPATNDFERYLDDNYTDAWIHHRFQNLVVETAPRHAGEE